jgi:hypothetical protein
MGQDVVYLLLDVADIAFRQVRGHIVENSWHSFPSKISTKHLVETVDSAHNVEG